MARGRRSPLRRYTVLWDIEEGAPPIKGETEVRALSAHHAASEARRVEGWHAARRVTHVFEHTSPGARGR